MDNWLYKLASGLIWQTASSDLKWEDTDLVNFTVEIFIQKKRIRVSESKNILARDVVYSLVQNTIPANWSSTTSHPHYDTIKASFKNARPIDIKFQLDPIAMKPSFKYVTEIRLDWDSSFRGI